MKETESKYDAPDGARLPPLADLPQVARAEGQEKLRLEAEYYDTSDLRLIRAGITLRRRRGGDDAGWHLKVPDDAATPGAGSDGTSRREIRLPEGEHDGQVPPELEVLVRAHTRGEPLRPVARVTTVRRRTILLGALGESLAEVAADEVSAQSMADKTALSRWHEVEVELTGGGRALLLAAGKQLRKAGMTPAGRASKLERVLGQQRVARAGERSLTASSPAGQVVLSYLMAHVERLKALDPKVRSDEPDSIHQMRVSTRRMRSTLRTFRPIMRRSSTRELAGELKWLGAVLGQARDAEVMVQHIRAALHDIPVEQNVGPAEARVQAHFAGVGAAARAGVIAALDSPRYFALLDSLDQFLADPPFSPEAAGPAREVLPAAVRRVYRQTKRRMRRAWQAPAGPPRDAALHEARKAAKRTRYAGEAVTPALGGKAAKFTKRIKRVQSVLGDHQDTVVARPVMRELGMSAHLAGENSYSYGLLHGHDTCAARQLQAKARLAWRRTHQFRR
ncbi:MAG TPA: CYTH and CHAD domain-containing protein [Streptosporangiaceae bacterium]